MSDEPLGLPADPEEDDPFESFLDGIEDAPSLFDPNTIVSIRSTNGASFEVPIDGPTAIRDVLTAGGLTVSTGIEYWVDGVAVEPDFLVAPGTTVTAVGLVKGG